VTWPSEGRTDCDICCQWFGSTADDPRKNKSEGTEDADVIVVSYGITARVAERAIGMARKMGAKVGKLRLITVWPFPEARLRELAGKTKAFVVPELNMGQVVLEVERVAGGKCKTISIPHAGGSVHRPEDILKVILEAAR
jgi:2-oxoglutarate ferredoxin oxidoreductase subunit alpha